MTLHSLQAGAWREAQRRHLMPFFEGVFPSVAGTALQLNWHQKALALALEEVVAGRIKRLLLTVPPRSGKSIFASVALPAWVLGKDPRAEIICASYAQDLAVKFHNQCRSVMRSARYQSLFPRTVLSSSKNNETEFLTTAGGGRFATSVGGVLTGRGGELIILDDPMKPQDALSDAVRASVNDWYDMTVLSRLNNKLDGVIIVVMQRLHVDDLAGHLLEQGGWTHINLPAIAEIDELIPIGHGKVHARRTGDLLHPDREPIRVLDELKRNLGAFHFSAQYQQRPIPVGGNLFKWEWFQRYATPPRREGYAEVIHSWDTASKEGVLNDHSVCTTWLIADDRYYLLDLHRARLDFPSLRRRVIELAERDRPDAILIEDKNSGTHLAQDLKSNSGLTIFPINPEGDKVTRASSSTLEIATQRVFLPEQALWLNDFKAELLGFPNMRHDDQVDSLSQFLLWARKRNQFVPRIRSLEDD